MKAKYALYALVPWIFLLLAYRPKSAWIIRARNAGLVLLLVPFLGIPGRGQKSDHVLGANCSVVASKNFTSYELKYHVIYSDSLPFDLLVETNAPDDTTLWDECEAFKKAMYASAIEEGIKASKTRMQQLKHDHFFVDARKLAKK